LPLIFEVTEGQRHDLQPAQGLLEKAASRCLLADKAYDSDALRAALTAQGCSAVIPSKTSRAQRLAYDKELSKARSEIECTFNLLKQARRFATRYEKNAQLRSRRGSRMRVALAKNLATHSSRPWASLISIETTRTSISLPAWCPASSSSRKRESTSSRAADSVADPRAER